MADFKSDSSFSRVSKNGVFSAFRYGFHALSAILFIPFLVKQYGSGSFGLIALAGFLTQYVGLISNCVGTAVARFINIALNQNDWRRASEIFSTALVGNAILLAIQLPLFAVGIWKLDVLIDFPPDLARDFRLLVTCSVLVFLVTLVSGVLSTPVQAANRLDLSAKLDIFRQLVRIMLLVALILTLGAKLWIIGVVDLGIALCFAPINYLIYRKLASSLVFKLNLVSAKWIRPVLSMAGWSLVAMLGWTLFVSSDVWLTNRFVSKEMAGVYAALLVWPNSIVQIGGQISALIAPVYMIDFAKGDHARIARVCLFANKMLGFIAAFGVGCIFVFSNDIIRVWLGSDFVEYATVLKLVSVGLTFTLGGAVVWCIFPAIDKTHWTGLSNLATGILNLVLSWWLVHLGWGVFGVAIGTLVSTTLKTNVIEAYWVSRELEVPYMKFVANYIYAAIILGLVYSLNMFFGESNLVVKLVAFASVVLVLLPCIFYTMMSSEEREWFFLQAVNTAKRFGVIPTKD